MVWLSSCVLELNLDLEWLGEKVGGTVLVIDSPIFHNPRSTWTEYFVRNSRVFAEIDARAKIASSGRRKGTLLDLAASLSNAMPLKWKRHSHGNKAMGKRQKGKCKAIFSEDFSFIQKKSVPIVSFRGTNTSIWIH